MEHRVQQKARCALDQHFAPSDISLNQDQPRLQPVHADRL
jgi:hypothetical protein